MTAPSSSVPADPTSNQVAGIAKRLRTMRAKRAANLRASKPDYDGAEATRAARAAQWASLEQIVDPEGKLPPDERLARAKRLWQARMLEGRIKKAGSRRAR